jgi:quercetin dioxygenase-like cupin family protein
MLQKKRPRIQQILESENYKLTRIFGGAGMEIGAHQVSEESVLLVQQGEAWLTFNNQIVPLKKNDCRVIPAHTVHSLKMSKDFEGVTIMRPHSNFDFSLPEFKH